MSVDPDSIKNISTLSRQEHASDDSKQQRISSSVRAALDILNPNEDQSTENFNKPEQNPFDTADAVPENQTPSSEIHNRPHRSTMTEEFLIIGNTTVRIDSDIQNKLSSGLSYRPEHYNEQFSEDFNMKTQNPTEFDELEDETQSNPESFEEISGQETKLNGFCYLFLQCLLSLSSPLRDDYAGVHPYLKEFVEGDDTGITRFLNSLPKEEQKYFCDRGWFCYWIANHLLLDKKQLKLGLKHMVTYKCSQCQKLTVQPLVRAAIEIGEGNNFTEMLSNATKLSELLCGNCKKELSGEEFWENHFLPNEDTELLPFFTSTDRTILDIPEEIQFKHFAFKLHLHSAVYYDESGGTLLYKTWIRGDAEAFPKDKIATLFYSKNLPAVVPDMECEEESNTLLMEKGQETKKTDRLARKILNSRLEPRRNPTATEFLKGSMTEEEKLRQIAENVIEPILRPVLKRNSTKDEKDGTEEDGTPEEEQTKGAKAPKSDRERNKKYTLGLKKKLSDAIKATTELERKYNQKLQIVQAKIDGIPQNFEYKDLINEVIQRLEARGVENFDVKNECNTDLIKEIYEDLGYNSPKSFGTATNRAQDVLFKRMKENEGNHYVLLLASLEFIDGLLPSSADSDHRNSQQRRGQKRQSSSPQGLPPQRSGKVARS